MYYPFGKVKRGKCKIAVTVYYEGTDGTVYEKSENAPTDKGDYTVTFDVAADDPWEEAENLTAGTLKIVQETFTLELTIKSAKPIEFFFEGHLTNINDWDLWDDDSVAYSEYPYDDDIGTSTYFFTIDSYTEDTTLYFNTGMHYEPANYTLFEFFLPITVNYADMVETLNFEPITISGTFEGFTYDENNSLQVSIDGEDVMELLFDDDVPDNEWTIYLPAFAEDTTLEFVIYIWGSSGDFQDYYTDDLNNGSIVVKDQDITGIVISPKD